MSTKEIRSLSVSNIADIYCPTRRLLYLDKGINRPPAKRSKTTWGRIAGNIVEDYVRRILEENVGQDRSYSSLIGYSKSLDEEFINSRRNISQLEKLRNIEKTAEGQERSETGDADWLLKLLKCNGRAELGSKVLHSLIRETESLDITDIEIETDQKKLEIKPKEYQIGISSPARPDFIILRSGIVGDIKTGVIKEDVNPFKNHFLLTCAGYALACENQYKGEHDINWGMIYLIPTRVPSDYIRPLTFAQLYVFPIDDHLRRWFLDKRDEAYDIISKPDPPHFPSRDERHHCKYCRFRDYCVSRGLE